MKRFDEFNHVDWEILKIGEEVIIDAHVLKNYIRDYNEIIKLEEEIEILNDEIKNLNEYIEDLDLEISDLQRELLDCEQEY